MIRLLPAGHRTQLQQIVRLALPHGRPPFLTASAPSSTSHYAPLCEVSRTPRASPAASAPNVANPHASSAPRSTSGKARSAAPAPRLRLSRRAVTAPAPRSSAPRFRRRVRSPHHGSAPRSRLRSPDVKSCPRRSLDASSAPPPIGSGSPCSYSLLRDLLTSAPLRRPPANIVCFQKKTKRSLANRGEPTEGGKRVTAVVVWQDLPAPDPVPVNPPSSPNHRPAINPRPPPPLA